MALLVFGPHTGAFSWPGKDGVGGGVQKNGVLMDITSPDG